MSVPVLAWNDLPHISAGQMQQIMMLATGKYGLDNRLLVEHTARNLVEVIDIHAPEGPILVVAGRGNNGSGGLATARLLALRGRRVWVVPTHEAENYSGTPREELEHLRHFDTVRVKSSMPRMNYSCVVDAAIGTNLEGPPRGRTLDVITVMNNQHEGCCVISLDAPTGMSADDGSIPGAVVNAGVTMSVALPKIGIRPGGSVGRLYLGDIGIPPSLYGSLGLGSVQLPAFVSEVVG